MLKIILSILISSTCFAQLQSLAEYNRTLAVKLSERKTLTPKEFKTLRIRLGTEVTSADDLAYKNGELLRLLQYGIFFAYLSRSKEEEKLVQEMWNKYLELPQPASWLGFNIDYYIDFFKETNASTPKLFELGDYALKYAPKGPKKSFFSLIVREKCLYFMYRKKLADSENCWKQHSDYIKDFPNAKNSVAIERLKFFSKNYTLQKEFTALASEILSNEEMKDIWPVVNRIRVLHNVRIGDLTSAEKDIDEIKKADRTANMNELLSTLLYIRQGKIDKALDLFKGIPEKDLSSTELPVYNTTGSEIFFEKGDMRKALYYANKALDLDGGPLDKIPLHFRKLLLEISIKQAMNVAEYQKQFDDYEKLMKDLNIEDPELVLTIKAAQYLLDDKKTDRVNELKKLFSDYKNYQYPTNFSIRLLDKIVAELAEPKIEIQTKVPPKAPGKILKAPVATPTASPATTPAQKK